MVKVSIIIPVYNTEKYLNECLDSVVNQTLDDIEIICINDGSTDNSLNILESYAKKDNRIKIITQKNSGQGCARNKGLSTAKGDYIYFIDSDDTILPETLNECYNLAVKNNLDFLMFQLINYDEDRDKYYKDGHYDMPAVAKFVKNNVFSYNDLNELIFRVAVSPANKLYNKDFLDRIDVKFPEDIIFEDNIFFWNVFFNAKRILFVPKHYYIRRRHSSSTTGNPGIRFSDTLEVNNRIFEIFKEFNLFEKYKSRLVNRKINLAYRRFNEVIKEVKPEFFNKMHEDFQLMIEEYSYELVSYLSKKNKLIFNNVINSKSSEEFELLMEKDRLLAENKKLKKELKRIDNENELILTSTSWKVTKPLRFIKNLRR